jgi:cyclopropane fatty-acyl-phospholipid synthase-like methyltransferase
VQFNGTESFFSDWDEYASFAEAEAEFVSSILRLGPEDRVLDLGCGTGFIASLLAARVQSMLAVDYSEHALEVACSDHSAPNIEYRRQNIGSLDYSTLDVDKAYAVGVLHYLDNYEVVRILLSGLLDKGTEVVVVDVPDESMKSQVTRDYDTETYSHLFFDEEKLKRDFDNITFWRGMFPSYGNDPLRFSFLLKP